MQAYMRTRMCARIILREGASSAHSGGLNEQTQDKILRLLFQCVNIQFHFHKVSFLGGGRSFHSVGKTLRV